LLLDLITLEKISQLWFFHAHYIVHQIPWLYKIVHKFHHQHIEPSVFTAIHCTIWEMMFLNLPAVALGPLLILPNPVVHYTWYLLAGVYTPIVHSGYNLIPFLDAPYHDEHHRRLNCNFGSRVLDKWYGTNST
jgi:sterol desaturase/sphingolipid hydroxylase (fatty acid hydroxylase superfamily)